MQHAYTDTGDTDSLPVLETKINLDRISSMAVNWD